MWRGSNEYYDQSNKVTHYTGKDHWRIWRICRSSLLLDSLHPVEELLDGVDSTVRRVGLQSQVPDINNHWRYEERLKKAKDISSFIIFTCHPWWEQCPYAQFWFHSLWWRADSSSEQGSIGGFGRHFSAEINVNDQLCLLLSKSSLT